jgi:hypothetical protein
MLLLSLHVFLDITNYVFCVCAPFKRQDLARIFRSLMRRKQLVFLLHVAHLLFCLVSSPTTRQMIYGAQNYSCSSESSRGYLHGGNPQKNVRAVKRFTIHGGSESCSYSHNSHIYLTSVMTVMFQSATSSPGPALPTSPRLCVEINPLAPTA